MIDFNDTNKIWIQSMTNTKTHNLNKTLTQINALKAAGCELVRVAVFDEDDANSLEALVKQSPLPIIADIHFNYLFALRAIKANVFKIRLNPGNISDPNQIAEIINLAKKHNTWIRIGVNCGSIPEDLLMKNNNVVDANIMNEALSRYLEIFEKHNFKKIVISLKASDPILNEQANLLAYEKFKYPIHVGVTEAGTLIDATIKSTIGLSNLLRKNIARTIRISISDNPVVEIEIIRKLLNFLHLKNDMVNIVSCPTCGRLNYNMFDVVNEINDYVKNLYFPLKISILGCVVNGIGEGKHADIGLAGSGNKVILFEKGKIIKTIDSSIAVDELKKLIDKYYQDYLLKNNNK